MTWWHGSSSLVSSWRVLAILLCASPALSFWAQPASATERGTEPLEDKASAEAGTHHVVASVSASRQSELLGSSNESTVLLRSTSDKASQQTVGKDRVNPFVCADEGQTCRCVGTVVFAKKFARGQPGWGVYANAGIVARSTTRISKTLEAGESYIKCTKEAFGDDPAPMFFKYCMCFEGNTTNYEDSMAPAPAGYQVSDIWPYLLAEQPQSVQILSTLTDNAAAGGRQHSKTRIVRSELEHAVVRDRTGSDASEAEGVEPYVCADEGQQCKCMGTVVFGQKYIGGGWRTSGTLINADTMISNYHVATVSASEVRCSSQTFGEDPAVGSVKYCYCFTGEVSLQGESGAPSSTD